MRSDVDLFVSDAAGKEHATSEKRGTDAETVELGLKPGTHYIEVRNASSAETPYYMTVEVRPARPYSHWGLAYPAVIGAAPSVFNSEIDDDGPDRWVTFVLDTPTMVKVTLETIRGDAKTDIDLGLISASTRQLIAKSDRADSAPEEVAELLAPGRYFVLATRKAGKSAEIRLTLEQTRDILDPPLPGRVVSTHDDWSARELVGKDGKRRCLAVTIAKASSPQAWRARRPYMGLMIAPGETSVDHHLDESGYFDPSKPVAATISNRGGGSVPLNVRYHDRGRIMALIPCGNNFCVSPEALRGLTQGSMLTLRATTKDGRPAEVAYSLVGYQAAIRAMNAACGNTALTGGLVAR